LAESPPDPAWQGISLWRMQPKSKRVRRKAPKAVKSYLPGLSLNRICYERCTKNKSALELIQNNYVNISVPAPATDRSKVEQIAAGAFRPFPIESLSDELDKRLSVRGTVFSESVEQCLNEIAIDYLNMRWWVSDKGLNMGPVEPEPADLGLSEFDVLAGKLAEEKWTDNGLPREALLVIAKALDDEKKFTLEEHLQPGQWKKIDEHNQLYPRRPIKTFEQAALDSRFVRGVRLRLCSARSRLRAAQTIVYTNNNKIRLII
jgi:hypothetical protein